MKAHIKSGTAPSQGKLRGPNQITKAIEPHYTIRQYYPTFTPLPQPGEIRELCDRGGNVAALARVIKTDPNRRLATLQRLELDPSGREI